MRLGRRRALLGLGMGLAAVGTARTWAAPPPLLRIVAGEPTQGGWLRGDASPQVSALTLDGVPVTIDGGAFFVAFDRDAGPAARLIANGGAFVLPLSITPRAWQIERVDAPFHPPGVADEEFARLRTTELARIAAARAMITGASGWRQQFAWPVEARISGLFGAQRIYRGTPGSFHSGIDLAAPAGTVYSAPADGVVVLAASATPFTLEGHLLMVDHGAGLNSAFLHGSELLVKERESVKRGQPIGRVGMTGRATGPHLHWGVKWHDARLDPLLLAGPMGEPYTLAKQ